ncbi:MAG: CHC2 zinc finger domain-containing protein, partial [Patescibacteria group bacterium]
MSTNGDIQEVKARVDIVAVVSRYVKLKKAGRNYTGLCPFHGEKTPSFNVNPSLGIFKCFGCGKSGDAIKFVQEIEHLEFPQALEK